MTYTVQWFNGATGTYGYRGTFGDLEAAYQYQQSEIQRSRPFMRFQVWKGTPHNPIAQCDVNGTGVK